MASRSCLIQIPNELLLNIAHLLSPKDLLCVGKTCKRLHDPFINHQLYYVTASSDDAVFARLVLFTVETSNKRMLQYLGSLRSKSELLSFSSITFKSSIPRDPLRRIYKAAGRRTVVCPLPAYHQTCLDDELIFEAKVRGRVSHGSAYPPSSELCVSYVSYDWDFGGHYWCWKPIHIAAQNGDHDLVEILLGWGADINALATGACDCCLPQYMSSRPVSVKNTERASPITSIGVTALHLAIDCGSSSLAIWLLDYGASWAVGVPSATRLKRKLETATMPTASLTVLHSAALSGDLAVVKHVLNMPGFTPKWLRRRCPSNRYTALDFAIDAGHYSLISLLIKSGVHLGGTWFDPLTICCLCGQLDKAMYLLENRAFFGLSFRPDSAVRALCLRSELSKFVTKLSDFCNIVRVYQLEYERYFYSRVRTAKPLPDPQFALRAKLIHALLPFCSKGLQVQKQKTTGNDIPDLREATPDWLDSSTPIYHAVRSQFHEMIPFLCENRLLECPPASTHQSLAL